MADAGRRFPPEVCRRKSPEKTGVLRPGKRSDRFRKHHRICETNRIGEGVKTDVNQLRQNWIRSGREKNAIRFVRRTGLLSEELADGWNDVGIFRSDRVRG